MMIMRMRIGEEDVHPSVASAAECRDGRDTVGPPCLRRRPLLLLHRIMPSL